MTDLSPSHASPSFPNMTVISLQSDEIEDIWATHVKRVMTDASGAYAVNTFHLFARLFQVNTGWRGPCRKEGYLITL